MTITSEIESFSVDAWAEDAAWEMVIVLVRGGKTPEQAVQMVRDLGIADISLADSDGPFSDTQRLRSQAQRAAKRTADEVRKAAKARGEDKYHPVRQYPPSPAGSIWYSVNASHNSNYQIRVLGVTNGNVNFVTIQKSGGFAFAKPMHVSLESFHSRTAGYARLR